MTTGESKKSNSNTNSDDIIKQENKGTNNKIENFQFDQIVKKKKNNTQKNNSDESRKSVKRNEEKKKIVYYRPYKYGRIKFEDLTQLSQFLLREYHNIEKHATNLLGDTEFVTWLRTQSKNEQQFNDWVEKIL